MDEHPRSHPDIDTGEPLVELQDLLERPRSGFSRGIQNSIQRRIFTADAVDFSIMGLFRTLLDYILLPFQVLERASKTERRD